LCVLPASYFVDLGTLSQQFLVLVRVLVHLVFQLLDTLLEFLFVFADFPRTVDALVEKRISPTAADLLLNPISKFHVC